MINGNLKSKKGEFETKILFGKGFDLMWNIHTKWNINTFWGKDSHCVNYSQQLM